MTKKLNTFVTRFLLGLLWVSTTVVSTQSSTDRITIYIDADYSLTPASAEAIEVGVRTAFSGTWAEAGIEIISRDHRSNSRRSFDTIQDAWRDPSAVAVIGGMQSPPYFANGTEINEGGMPLLLPWAAGGMLTRLVDGDENWIFRLSVDDTKAAGKLVDYGTKAGCERASLAFVDNPWGNGNAKRISEEITDEGGIVAAQIPLPFNAGEQSIIEAMHAAESENSDCLYLISGLALGKSVIKAASAMATPPRVISHWGLLGDKVTDAISYESTLKVRLTILGTCGLNTAHRAMPGYALARATAREVSNASFDPEYHPAPHGFFHAHDLGLILIEALDAAAQTELWNEGPKGRRAALREALYQLEDPVEGLLKIYEDPFEPVGLETFDGHEALGSDDLCMTMVNRDGHIINLE